MDELWRDVPGTRGEYQVSNLGKARSIKNGRVRNLKGSAHPTGYITFAVCQDGKETTTYIHQAVLLAFVGPCPDGMEVRHLNSVKIDARLENLCYGTKADNEEDKKAHGTWPAGEKNNAAILTEEIVLKIRKEYKFRDASCNGVALAKKYNTTQRNISSIIRGKSWTHVSEERCG